MDPGLEEAIRGRAAESEIEAAAFLRPGEPVPPGLSVVARFGPIVTCRIPAGRVREVRAHPAVVSLKASRIVEPVAARPADAASVPAQGGREPAPGEPAGRNVVIGFLDWGCDFAHPAFRRPDGGTRLLALWDQRARRQADGIDPYGYGRLLTREQIDAALATNAPYAALDYLPAASDLGSGAHATHVMSIAAGSASAPEGARGVAPEAELVFVHLASGLTSEEGDLGDSVRILEALDFIRSIAGERPFVVNQSLGRTGGDHSGRSLVEMAIDQLIEEAPGRAVVQSAGNYFDKRIAAQGRLRPGRIESLDWEIAPGDPTRN